MRYAGGIACRRLNRPRPRSVITTAANMEQRQHLVRRTCAFNPHYAFRILCLCALYRVAAPLAAEAMQDRAKRCTSLRH